MGHLYTKTIEAAAHGQHRDNQGDNPRPTSTCARRSVVPNKKVHHKMTSHIAHQMKPIHRSYEKWIHPTEEEEREENSGETGLDQGSLRKTPTVRNAQASGLWQCLPHASHWAYTTWGNLEVCHYNIFHKPDGNQKQKQVLGTREAAPWWKHILIKSLYVQFPASISKGSQLPTSSSSRENPNPQASVDTCIHVHILLHRQIYIIKNRNKSFKINTSG